MTLSVRGTVKLTRTDVFLCRLCDVIDEDVEVIYISPFPLPDEVLQYFYKLLQLGGVAQPDNRIRILYPENFVRYIGLCFLCFFRIAHMLFNSLCPCC